MTDTGLRHRNCSAILAYVLIWSKNSAILFVKLLMSMMKIGLLFFYFLIFRFQWTDEKLENPRHIACLVRLYRSYRNHVPTRLHVEQHFLFLKESEFQTNKEVAPKVAASFLDIWSRAGIPSQPLKNAKTKISRLMQLGSKATQHGQNKENNFNRFQETLSQLFDITACQCHDLCSCQCSKELKVLRREHAFLSDQRTTRNMHIDGVEQKD